MHTTDNDFMDKNKRVQRYLGNRSKSVKVLKILGWIFAGIMGSMTLLIGVLFLTGQFKVNTIELSSITFDEVEVDDTNVFQTTAIDGLNGAYVVADDFETSISFAPANATNKKLTLKVTEGAGIVSVPNQITAGQKFKVSLIRDANGYCEGGEVSITAYDSRGLTATSTPLTFFVDQSIQGLTTNLESTYKFSTSTQTFSVSSTPSSSLNPTNKPATYSSDITKPVSVEVYDTKANVTPVITNLTNLGNTVDVTSGVVKSNWSFVAGRDGETTIVVKSMDTYRLLQDYQALGVTSDNFLDKKEEANAFLNKYRMNILQFSIAYDVESMTTDSVEIGGKYKITREQVGNKYVYSYAIFDNEDDQYRQGYEFIAYHRRTADHDVIDVTKMQLDIDTYTSFQDAVQYLYITTAQKTLVINDQISELTSTDLVSMDVHNTWNYSISDLKEKLGVAILPASSTSNLDSYLYDIKTYGVRLVDGTYMIEDYATAEGEAKTEVETLVELLNSEYNFSDQNKEFGVLSIDDPLTQASLVVTNPAKVGDNWTISAYNKPESLSQKLYLIFTYKANVKLTSDAEETTEIIYYSLTQVDMVEESVSSIKFLYQLTDNNKILSTTIGGTSIGGQVYNNTFVLPSDYVQVKGAGNTTPTYTTVKYFASADSVAVNGKFVIKVNETPYTFNGVEYYEITETDRTTGRPVIVAQNASLYDTTRGYLPVEIYAFVVKTDINGDVIMKDGQYIDMSNGGTGNNSMNYIVRPFLDTLYAYTNFEGTEYILRNAEGTGYDVLYEYDGEVSMGEVSAIPEGAVTIVRADRTINVLIDQEFEVILTNKIIQSNGADYYAASKEIDYVGNFKRALEDTDLINNLGSYITFDGVALDSDGYNQDASFALGGAVYDSTLGVIRVTLRVKDNLDNHYINFQYKRNVDDVAVDTNPLVCRIEVKGEFLEISNTDSYQYYGASGYADHTQQAYPQDKVEEVTIKAAVVGNVASWKVQDYANRSEAFKSEYANYYAGQEISEDGTINSNYAFTLKGFGFTYGYNQSSNLDAGVFQESMILPSVAYQCVPYLVTYNQSEQVLTDASSYVALSVMADATTVSIDVQFLKAPVDPCNIVFVLNIFAYETTTEENVYAYDGKNYFQRYTIMTDWKVQLSQDQPQFDFKSFDENGYIETGSQVVNINSASNQSELKAGTRMILNGDATTSAALSVSLGGISTSDILNACTFEISQNNQSLLYFYWYDGNDWSTGANIAAGTNIQQLYIGANATNTTTSGTFTVSLLGYSQTYYIIVSSNIKIQYRLDSSSEWYDYNTLPTIEVDADTNYDLSQYFQVSKTTADDDGSVYSATFKVASGDLNYFSTISGTSITTGRAFDDKKILIAVGYQVQKAGEDPVGYTTSCSFYLLLKGTGSVESKQNEFETDNERQYLDVSISAGSKEFDLTQFVELGNGMTTNYQMDINWAGIAEDIRVALFGSSYATNAFDSTKLKISSNAYYAIVKDVPIEIYYKEVTFNGDVSSVELRKTIYYLNARFAPSVEFALSTDTITMEDGRTPDNTVWGSQTLYTKDDANSIIQLNNQLGNDEDLFYYGFDSATLYMGQEVYIGDVVTVVTERDGDTLLTLALVQQRSVQTTLTLTLKITTKYGSNIIQNLTIEVTPNYVVEVHYPLEDANGEKIRVGKSIDLLTSYLNQYPRLYVYQNINGEKVGLDTTGKEIVTNVTAWCSSIEETSRFTMNGSSVTLNSSATQNNLITLNVTLFNGIVVEYKVMRVDTTTSQLTYLTGEGDSVDNPISIYATQPFSINGYIGAGSNQVIGVLENQYDVPLFDNTNDTIGLYEKMYYTDSYHFGETATTYNVVLNIYDINAVAGDTVGVGYLYITVLPNIVIEATGTQLAANHSLPLSNYVTIERGYGTDELIIGGTGANVTYTSNNTDDEDLITITSNDGTYYIEYGENIVENMQVTITFVYHVDGIDRDYQQQVILTIIPDVNFNYYSGGITVNGSNTNGTYSISKQQWLVGGAYTDTQGNDNQFDGEESFVEVLTFVGQEDSVTQYGGITLDTENSEIVISAINKEVKVKVTTTYTCGNGTLVAYTIVTIQPNVKIAPNTNMIRVYAGSTLTPEVSGSSPYNLSIDNIYNVAVTAFTLTPTVVTTSGTAIQPRIVFDLTTDNNFQNQDLAQYLFVDTTGNIHFRNVSGTVNVYIPFRLDLTGQNATYANCYNSATLYFRLTIVESVTGLALTSTYASATSTSPYAFMDQYDQDNQLLVRDIVTIQPTEITIDTGNTIALSINNMLNEFSVSVTGLWNSTGKAMMINADYALVSYSNGTITFGPCDEELVLEITIALSGRDSDGVLISQYQVMTYVELPQVTVSLLEGDETTDSGNIEIESDTDNSIMQLKKGYDNGDIYTIYFQQEDVYTLTTDQSINNSKTYYTLSGDTYEVVATPVVGDIATYYERTIVVDADAGETYEFDVRDLFLYQTSAKSADETYDLDLNTSVFVYTINAESGGEWIEYLGDGKIQVTLVDNTVTEINNANASCDVFVYIGTQNYMFSIALGDIV